MSNLTVSLSPHIRDGRSTQSIMRDVLIALLPACVAGAYYFGPRALMLLALSTASAVLSEWLWCRAFKKESTIADLSAAVTGLLLGMNVPPTAPWWLVVIGSAFAVIVVKQMFGGLGQNFMNPALAARAFLLASWPVRMTTFIDPATDAITSATPLASIYGKAQEAASVPALSELLIGNMPGVIGEVSKAALLVGFAYLLIRQVVEIKVPLTYIGTVFALSALFGSGTVSLETGFYAIASGGLFLGAIFMATDYVTAPLTSGGKYVFAFGCGLITFIIRKFGKYPEGITYAILLMEVASPLIDRYIRPRKYGEVAKAK